MSLLLKRCVLALSQTRGPQPYNLRTTPKHYVIFRKGEEQGYEYSPWYKSVPKAAARDFKLFELLVLVDAIRDSRAREREIAVKEIRARLHQ